MVPYHGMVVSLVFGWQDQHDEVDVALYANSWRRSETWSYRI